MRSTANGTGTDSPVWAVAALIVLALIMFATGALGAVIFGVAT